MQVIRMSNRIVSFLMFCLLTGAGFAQVNSVEFGRSRIQHKKFTWKFYQSPNFNSYFNQGGLELGKFVAQLAEEELRSIEEAVEYSLQRRVNIIIYNHYNDMRSTNIGLGDEWINAAGGVTKLVNNKMVVYFDGDHAHLKQQVREGIAKVLLDNQLFGEDIGEFASNQALLDLPQWLTDGYVKYIAEPWSTERDDELKSAMLSGDYNNFYQFAFKKPLLAGQAFWYYVSEKYKKENVPYFLYLARIYKNLNSASQRIAKKKFKALLADFMQYEQDKYFKDIRQRRNVPKGTISVSEEIRKSDFFRFNANPNPRNNSYAVVEYKKGIYSVKYNENYETAAVLLKNGVRTRYNDINPNYPLMAWDGKGTRLAVIYWEGGKIKMFVYDVIARYKRDKQAIEGFDQILDVQYMLDANTLLLSAVRNGHSDLFTMKIDNQKVEQLTNDVYDDLNPSFVSFPNKSGIIFSSNRPGPDAVNADTVLPSRNRFNIFLLDYLTKKQISQLTNLKYGNGRFPSQYNVNHFTFVADENGIGNRWAGFFSTQREGLDTLYYVGDEILRNPADRELDSTLAAWQRNEPDSISYFQVTRDSTYTFPITNYQSSLLETRIAGDRGQVSEVVRQGNYKFLYKLRIDSLTLRRRNVNARPTEFMKKIISQQKAAEGKAILYQKPGTDTTKSKDIFITEFGEEKADTSRRSEGEAKDENESVLSQSKLYNYRLKFSTDNVISGISNNILINRYQPYGGGSGPIQLGNGSNLNFTFRATISDLFEDYKFTGGFRLGTNLKDNDYLLSFQNLRKRFDWGITYYRTSNRNFYAQVVGTNDVYNTQLNTSFYQLNGTYPLNEIKSLRATLAYRRDRTIIKAYNNTAGMPQEIGLALPDILTQYALTRFEYVHDNTLNPMQNIWDGLRWKIYLDMNIPINDPTTAGKFTYNLGLDGRYYVPIYRHFIWAGRAAADFSWGNQKLIYYLGGVDGWVSPQFNNNQPAADQEYAFQSLAVNMRGFNQNIANGNNAFVINSEFRLPVFSTFLNKPINNAFIRNFQIVQFIDLGTAWNGRYNKIERPTIVYNPTDGNNPVSVRIKAGGIGPFVGGYGFGARSTLLGYFLRFDVGWPMNGIFKEKPVYYFALGVDF